MKEFKLLLTQGPQVDPYIFTNFWKNASQEVSEQGNSTFWHYVLSILANGLQGGQAGNLAKEPPFLQLSLAGQNHSLNSHMGNHYPEPRGTEPGAGCADLPLLK